jgi:Ca2+-binding RTX toxin-like protein
MAISTNGAIITRLAGALYGEYLSNASYTEVKDKAASTVAAEFLTNDFATKTDAQLSTTILTNLGLTSITGLDNWLAAQLTAAGSTAAAKGAALVSILNGYANMTSDATYGSYATSFNTKVAASLVKSQTVGNAGGSFATSDVVTASNGTFTLTTGVDSGTAFTGGAGDDAFNGTLIARGTTGTTISAGDVLTGGAGTDTLSFSVTGDIDTTADGTDAHYVLQAVNTSGVEKILLSNFEDSTDADANIYYDAAIATGLTTVGLSSSGDEGDTVFQNVRNLVNAEMANGSGDLTVSYINSTITAGTADAMSLTLSNVSKQSAGTGSAATFTADGIETLNVVSNTVANTVTLAGNALKTVNVSGEVAATLGTLPNTVTKLDAATANGAVTATLGTATDITVVGGAGNDTITTGASVGSTASVSGGAGAGDRLILSADAHLDTTTEGARYTNFETLGLAESAAAPANRAFSAANLAGLTGVAVTAYADTTDGDAATTGTVDFTALEAATKSMTVSGISTVENGHDLTLTVSASMAVNTTADEMTVTLGTSTASAGANSSAATGGVDKLLNVTLNQHETVSLVSQGAANYIATLTATELKTLNISGSKDLTIASVASATSLSKIDASSVTSTLAGVTISANASTTASEIIGGAGNDNLLGGTKADTISGGTGNDTLAGAAGADVVTGGEGDDSITGGAGIDNLAGGAGNDTFDMGTTVADFTGATTAETVDGGEGNDSISFGAASFTILSTELGGIKNVENLVFAATTDATTVTLTDAVFTANGSTTLTVDLDAATTGDVTLNASALTAANSINVIYTATTSGTSGSSIAGGAGSDSIRVDDVMLDDAITLAGGAGTDTLVINEGGTATSIASTVTGFERISFRTAATSYSLTANDSNSASTTVTVDGSNLTSGALSFNASAEDDAAYVITGGQAGDTLRGTATTTKIDTISGGGGDDAITGDAGVDSLDGGSGNDTFTVATTAHFTSLSSPETVIGGAGGNDMIDFTENAATTVNSSDLSAISGVEKIRFSGNNTASITLTDSVFTANGAATIAIVDNEATAALTVNAGAITSSANSISVTTKAGTATTVNESLLGGAGNDTFTFTTANGAGVPLESTDSVNGGAGTDTLAVVIDTTGLTAVTLTNVSNIEKITLANTAGTVNVGAITLADGNFVSVTGAVVDFSGSTTAGTAAIDASAEDDSTFVITGATGADTITGSQLADTINGGAGADRIIGHAGADQLSGGAGADTFVYTNAVVSSVSSVTHSSGTNADTITDFASGTDKLEVTLNYSTFSSALDISATRASAGVAGVTAAQDTLSGQRGQYVYDTTANQLYINVNNDNLIATSDFKIGINAGATASATVVEGDINFVITGGTNADTITAGSGADTIDGGSGTDSITGGAGADSITGGSGADTVVGGTGNDAIVLGTDSAADVVKMASTSAAIGSDTISGFEVGAGADTLQFDTLVTALANGVTPYVAGTAAAEAAISGKVAFLTAAAVTSVDEASEIAAQIHTSAADGAVTKAFSLAASQKAIVISMVNATGTSAAYVWYVENDSVAAVTAAEITLVGTLTTVTDIANWHANNVTFI